MRPEGGFRLLPVASERAALPVRPLPHVLVVGGAGYIGSILTRRLLAAGHRVRVFDAFFYGGEAVSPLLADPAFELRHGDTRDAEAVALALDDIDVVVHLGELVGDPACGLDPDVTRTNNGVATQRLATMAAERGIRRFVYPSSCSVYGASEELVDEETVPNPVSLYAELKVENERALLGMHGDAFEPVILRLATVFGLSPRPRFDLVVNLLSAQAAVEGSIVVQGGRQWRPFVHVSDVADVLAACVTAPSANVSGKVLNVGSDAENYTIGAIAELVREAVPGTSVQYTAEDDRRNYRVAFSRLAQAVGFGPTTSVSAGIAETRDALEAGAIADFRAISHSNVRAFSERLAARPARRMTPVERVRTPVGDLVSR
jgi:nucleoside-diphosphate-sugar epimerase